MIDERAVANYEPGTGRHGDVCLFELATKYQNLAIVSVVAAAKEGGIGYLIDDEARDPG